MIPSLPVVGRPAVAAIRGLDPALGEVAASLEILGAIRQGELGVAAAYGVVLTVMSTGAFLMADRSRRFA